jgi:hypothetical protein
MPIPFLVPAGMIAVKVAGKWVLKKIAKRLARRTRLKPKTEKALKKKSTKQGRKVQKKKTQDPVYNMREKMLRRGNRTMANIDPVNKKLTKTLRKSAERKNTQKAADKHHRDVKRLHTDKKFASDTLVREVSNILIGGKRGQMHPATWRNNMQRQAKKLTEEIKKEKEQLKKSIQKRKRTRELTKDAKRRRN